MTIRDSVSQTLEPRNYQYENWGQMWFNDVDVPNGTRNIRIDYNYGSAATPTYITDLSILYAAVRAYVNLSGGSYDDATSYSLGSKSVTIGEVYVNIREVISQFKARIKEILDGIGRRSSVVVI